MSKYHKWETVSSTRDRKVDRMKVPDGWIYLITELCDDGIGILFQNTVFVTRPLPGLFDEKHWITGEPSGPKAKVLSIVKDGGES